MKEIKDCHKLPLLVLVIYILTTLSSFVGFSDTTHSAGMFFAVFVLQLLIFVIPGMFYCKISSDDGLMSSMIRPFNLSSLFFVIPSSLLLFSVNALIRLTGIYFSDAGYTPSISSVGASGTDTVFIVLVYCLCPAIAEEFVFRGIVLSSYKKYGVACSIVMSSLLFAMLHFSLNDFLLYFVSGLILGCVAYVTRSAVPCMLIHLLNNVFTLFLEGYLWQMIRTPDNAVMFIFIVGSAVLLCAFICLSQAERIIYGYSTSISASSNPEKKEPSAAIRDFLVSLLSPAFLLCAIYFALASTWKLG